MRHVLTALLLVVAASGCSDDDDPASSAGSGGASPRSGNGSGASGASGASGSGGTRQAGSGGNGAGRGGSAGSDRPDAGSSGGRGGTPGVDAGTSCGAPCSGGMAAGYKVGCCGNRCIGLYNDPMNCGECGKVCPASAPHCNNGKCEAPPACAGTSCQAGESCCGNSCCTAGQLCCGVNVGPFVHQCHTPTEREPSCPIGCPTCMCASPDTRVATPDGERTIASLAVGDLVYSVDRGALTVVPIGRVGRTPAADHHVVRVALANGATLEISPGHPTADGRTFAELTAGSVLFGVDVLRVETIPYVHPFTYDILPASDSGTYVAGGVLIGSTLAPR